MWKFCIYFFDEWTENFLYAFFINELFVVILAIEIKNLPYFLLPFYLFLILEFVALWGLYWGCIFILAFGFLYGFRFIFEIWKLQLLTELFHWRHHCLPSLFFNLSCDGSIWFLSQTFQKVITHILNFRFRSEYVHYLLLLPFPLLFTLPKLFSSLIQLLHAFFFQLFQLKSLFSFVFLFLALHFSIFQLFHLLSLLQLDILMIEFSFAFYCGFSSFLGYSSYILRIAAFFGPFWSNFRARWFQICFSFIFLSLFSPIILSCQILKLQASSFCWAGWQLLWYIWIYFR